MASFNLVIEVLVVSSRSGSFVMFTLVPLISFQSRNRGTCRFKSDVRSQLGGYISQCRFNLVIEVLVVSSGKYVGDPL